MGMNIKGRLHGGEEKIKRWVKTKVMEERIEGLGGGEVNGIA